MDIPNKEYWTIGEVSDFAKIPKHTLRYWESEFKLIAPIRAKTGRRIYKRDDLELIFDIKDLLHDKRYTIEGVKKYLLSLKKSKSKSNDIEVLASDILKDIEKDLQQVLKLLKSQSIGA
ncbi:MAG: MerR family transcriptional regulator [Elusimicrobiota bacterium]|jgi:DNA-binding transcriptional MerR regulator|nr:MerR family transcriptional regulator [Elusimicrobiota bacterium]